MNENTVKDHQGSLAAVIQGNTVERLSYDAWGRRRNTTNFGYSNVSHTLDRGYTLHEHYDGFDLINVKFTLSERSAKLCLSTAEQCELGGANGRLYDPILGRMLSPDVVIQDEQSSQAYNRYSYCFNNPLRFTDPSGYVVTIPPEFEKYYMPEYLNDFDTYKKELEKLDAQNVAFNTELSEGKSVTTLTWTLGEDSYQMTIVDHGLKDYEQMCENSCVASALAAQEARFTSGNKELTENFILSLFDNPCEQGLYVDKVLPFYKKYSNIYKSNTYFDMTKQLAYYEKRSFDEMNLDRGVLIRLYNDQMRHVFNVSQAIEFVINNNIKSHEIRLWNSDFQNEKKGGYKSFTDYDMKKFFGKMGVLY